MRDPNRCTLSLRLRLGTATTRDNKRKKDARTSCAVAARGFKFDSLFFTSPRESSFCFLSPLFSLFLASPLFSQSVEYSIKIKWTGRVDNEKKKKRKKSRTRQRFLATVLRNFVANFNRSIDRNDISIVSKQLYSLFPLVSDQFNVDSLNKPRFNRLLALF